VPASDNRTQEKDTMQYRLISAIAAGALFANINGLPIAQPEV
jgi:hypothetical protein